MTEDQQQNDCAPAQENPASPPAPPAENSQDFEMKDLEITDKDIARTLDGLSGGAISSLGAQDQSAQAAQAPSPTPLLLGFIAVSSTAGQRSGPFPGRMVAYPIMPGFGPGEPAKELETRLKGDGGWSGFAVVLGENGVASLRPY